MDWLELKIDTSHAGLDAVTDMLEQQGVTGVMIDDEADFQSFLENNRQYWDYVDDDLLAQKKGVSRVTFYLERNEDAYGTVAAVRMAMSALKKDHPEYAPLLLTMADVADEDWENNWKQFYKPMEIGSRLLVVPEWEEAADPTRVKLVLNPGLTFGTGAHPSTQMVMEVMENVVKPGFHCLDLGSGSGILSIAALRLGAETAVGIDIDPKAEDIARENAAYNGFAAPAFTALTGNVTEDTALMDTLAANRYDLVLVNIVADVIIGLAPVLPHFLNESSTLICSGILDTRLSDVLDALTAAGLTVTATKAKDDWRCVTAIRKYI